MFAEIPAILPTNPQAVFPASKGDGTSTVPVMQIRVRIASHTERQHK